MSTHLFDRESLSSRLVAVATLITMIVGPTSPAFAGVAALNAASRGKARAIATEQTQLLYSATIEQPQSPAEGYGVDDASAARIPWSRAERLRPAELTAVENGPDAAELWQLFDNRADLGVRSSGKPIRFRIELPRPTELEAIGLFGQSNGSLTIAADNSGAQAETFSIAASRVGAGEWSRHESSKSLRTKTLWVTWRPGDGEASLRELELWGRPMGSEREAKMSRDEFPDALHTGLPKGAVAFWADAEEQTISVAAVSATNHAGKFDVNLALDPRSFDRAYLVYELKGLPHFSFARRSINHQPAVGGRGAGSNSEGGLQVEEISPEWLRKGINTISFLPIDNHDPVGYHVRAVRLVGLPVGVDTTDADSARAWHALRDENGGTGWALSRSSQPEQRVWRFASPTQPRSLEFKLDQETSGTLVLSNLGTSSRSRTTARLDGLRTGWHRIPLDRMPTTAGLSLSLVPNTEKPEQRVAISELAISGSPIPLDQSPQLAVTYPLSGECLNHRAHLRGFLKPAGDAYLLVNGTRSNGLVSKEGAFAIDVDERQAGALQGRPFTVDLEAVYANGQRAKRTVAIDGCMDQPSQVLGYDGRLKQPKADIGAPYGVTVRAGRSATLTFGGAKLEIPAGAVDRDVRLTIRPVSAGNVAPVDAGMSNVAPGKQAYRFGPHGMVFKKPIKVTLPYDQELVPEGYAPSDIRTFYYSETLRRWEQVGLIAQNDGQLLAVTDHFSDYINATIATPEHPGTQSLNPTSLKDLKLGDPSQGIASIEPPSVNNTGAATLSYPLELPPGRLGMQPHLAISYNSHAGNGWLGVGWNLTTSSIEIDTRFGVPRYDGTETYSLDGAMLAPNPAVSGEYLRRVESSFDRIRRLGSDPASYSWEVTDKSGTKYVYGSQTSSRLSDPAATAGNIFRWYLERVEDRFGNQILYNYAKDPCSSTSSCNNGAPYTQVYLASIDYTAGGSGGLAAPYHVAFTLDTAVRDDAFSSARSGFQVLTQRLLKSIGVYFGSTLIRRYDLAYGAGAFGKQLLQSVSLVGQDGSSTLYDHKFAYNGLPGTAAAPEVFASPKVWGTEKTGTGSNRSDKGLSNTESDMKGIEGTLGVGFGPLHLTASAGAMGGSDKMRMRTVDINGDGLMDFFDDSQGASVCSVNPRQPELADHYSGRPVSGAGAYFVGHTNRSGWNFEGSLGVSGIAQAGGGYSQTSAEDDKILADANGDGFVDLVYLDDKSQVRYRKNDGSGNFSGKSDGSGDYTLGEATLDDRSIAVADWKNASRTGMYPVATIMRWLAPFTGNVTLSGDISKVRPGGDGVKVSILKNGGTTPLWSETVAGNASTPCSPNSSGAGCVGSALTVPVVGGDRLYFLVDPINDINADDIHWSPTLTYAEHATNPDAREPYGAPTYQFSQQDDLRLAGLPDISWVANAAGTITVNGILAKLPTSDDIRVELARSPHDPSPPAPIVLATLPAASTATIDLSTLPNATFSVLNGDKYRLQVVADSPIDPKLALIKNARFTYTGNFCRQVGNGQPDVCGPLQYQYQDGQIVSAQILGDNVVMSADAVSRGVEPYFPRKEWRPFAPTQSVAASGSVSIAANVTVGGFNSLGHPAPPVVVLVQSVNQLIHKQILSPGSSANINVTATVPTGDQVFFSVLSLRDGEPAAISGSASVNGAALPMNVRYPDGQFYRYEPPINYPDAMAGGHHGWFVGDWDASVPFNEAGIILPNITQQYNTYMFCGPVTQTVTDPLNGAVPAQTWQCRGIDGYIGAGVQKPSKQAAGIEESGKLRSLRLAETSNFNVSATLVALTGTLGWGSTRSTLDFMDMNGDQYPDSVTGDGIRYHNGSLVSPGYGSVVNVNLGDLRDVEHRNVGLSLGVDSAQLLNMTKSDGEPDTLISTKVGLGVNYGSSASHVDLIDMNGDGLPDRVSQNPETHQLKVRLNLGYSFSDEIVWNGSGTGLSYADMGGPSAMSEFPGFDNNIGVDAISLQDTISNNASIGGTYAGNGGGAGNVRSSTRTLVQYIDMNGDGLPDKIMKHPNSDSGLVRVMINTGTGFAAASSWTLPDWGFDVNPSSEWNAWNYPTTYLFSQDANTLAFERQDGWQASFQVQFCFFVCIGASGFTSSSNGYSKMHFEDVDGDGRPDHVLKQDGDPNVYVKLNQIGKTNLLKSVTRPLGGTIQLDYDRVGNYVDAASKIDMPSTHWVLSRTTVDDGRGNSYTNTFDYNKYASDASTGLTTPSGFYDRDEREEYGFDHVRATRGNCSTGTCTEGDGSRVEQFFLNTGYHQRGLVSQGYELASDGSLMRGQKINYADPGPLVPRTSIFFPSEASRSTLYFEGSTSDLATVLSGGAGVAPKYHSESRTWDTEGNLVTITDWGDEQTSLDDALYTIEYYRDTTNHVTKAKSIKVSDSSGSVLRWREASYYPSTGALQTLTNHLTGGKNPVTGAVYSDALSATNFTYDAFGNIATVQDPSGYVLIYKYDTQTQQYRTSVTDSFGYISSSIPNYAFGKDASTTDINGQIESYVYDQFGRLTSVYGPADQGAVEATIAMSYGMQPGAAVFPAYAVTKHKDVQHPGNSIDTVTFVDGLRRVIQSKKDLDWDANGTGTNTHGMTVSGAVVYDSRGRVQAQGQPAFRANTGNAAIAPDETILATVAMTSPTSYTYDSLGRTKTVTVTDAVRGDAVTSTQYYVSTPTDPDTIGDGRTWLGTRVTDPLGNKRLSYADSRENRVAVTEFNTVGTSSSLAKLVTRYTYDALDQLVGVADAKSNITAVNYDTLGQMVKLVSPDAGSTEYRYDLAGNLGAKQTPNLVAQNKVIQYAYDYHRLKSITYPSAGMAQVTYSYGAPAEAGTANGNRANRIKQVNMEGGFEQRWYDAMGNVNKTVTQLKHLRETNLADQLFTMTYSYDSFGRMLTMMYPNWIKDDWTNVDGPGETVSYSYDLGGNIDKITGHHGTVNPQHPDHPVDFTYLTHMGYDEFEQRRVMTSGNGIKNFYNYDQYRRWLTNINADSYGTQEKQQGKPPAPFHRYEYTYDKVGNITHVVNRVSVLPYQNDSVRIGPLDVSYTYDNLYQIRSATGKYRAHPAYGYQYSNTFQYDELGNLAKKAQSQDRLVWDNQTIPSGGDPMSQLNGSRFDHNVRNLTYTLDYQYSTTRPHQATTLVENLPDITPAPKRTVTFDAAGNNTGNTFQGATRQNIWDDENRLKQVNDAGSMKAKFLYNPDGERTQRQTAAGDAFYVSQFFVFQPNKLPTKHIFAGDTRVATKTDPISYQTPVISFYHPDQIGSTSYVSTPAQDLVQHERYFPFGELWRDTDQEESDQGRPDALRREWLFTGKELDWDTGYYYYGARYYDAHSANWLSPDPILASYVHGRPNGGVFVPGNLALYTYARNNPLILVDPDGKRVVFDGRLSAEERNALLGLAQSLTDDALKVGQGKDGAFELSISARAKSGDKSAGTRLLRGVIGDKHTVRLNTVRDNEATGLDSSSWNPQTQAITVDPKGNTPFWVKGMTPLSDVQKGRAEISMGHELIHAYRNMQGKTASGTQELSWMDEHGATLQQRVSREEAETVGLIRPGRGMVTENSLRREQGLPARGAYAIPGVLHELQGIHPVGGLQ